MSITELLNKLSAESSDDELRAIIKIAKSKDLEDGHIAQLTTRLAQSGFCSAFDARFADLASTGGPSSLSTLVCPLILRSKGAVVPKVGVPGRPAGGIDVFATIPGFQHALSREAFNTVLRVCGYAHVLAGPDHAPLDARTFKIRQAIGAQRVPSLVIASLLAKKTCMGIRHSGIDIRVGPHGNFGDSFAQARCNAQRMVRVGDLLGIRVTCFLTDARVPYQPFIGRGEALIAVRQIVEGQDSGLLKQHRELCHEMAERVWRGMTVRKQEDATLMDVLGRHLAAQGSSLESFTRRVLEIEQSPTFEITAPDSGYVKVDMSAIRAALQQRFDDSLPKPDFSDYSGVTLLYDPRTQVTKGQPIMRVRSEPRHQAPLHALLSKSISVAELHQSRLPMEVFPS